MITPQDKELLENKGISEEQIAEQLACFEKGFPYLKLSAAASVEKGILAPDTDEQKKYLDAWEAYTQTDKVVVKFVPASGAASRMFKNLFEFLGADYDTPQTNFEKTFFEKIEKFAFYDDLNTACQRTAGKDIPTLVAAGNYKAVVAALLEGAGLNYGALPKGLGYTLIPAAALGSAVGCSPALGCATGGTVGNRMGRAGGIAVGNTVGLGIGTAYGR